MTVKATKPTKLTMWFRGMLEFLKPLKLEDFRFTSSPEYVKAREELRVSMAELHDEVSKFIAAYEEAKEKKFIDGFEVSLSKLAPKSGEVVLVKYPGSLKYEALQHLRDTVKAAFVKFGLPDTPVLICEGGLSIETTTEDYMAEQGWTRKGDRVDHEAPGV